jgi:hypothetical protein
MRELLWIWGFCRSGTEPPFGSYTANRELRKRPKPKPELTPLLSCVREDGKKGQNPGGRNWSLLGPGTKTWHGGGEGRDCESTIIFDSYEILIGRCNVEGGSSNLAQ